MNEIKQSLINEKENEPFCCYFDIYCGELAIFVLDVVVYLEAYLFKNNLN